MRKMILVFVMLSLLALVAAAAGANPDSSGSNSKFKPGDRVWTTTDVKVRSDPGLASAKLDSLEDGNSMIKGNTGKILEGPTPADGYNWWRVQYDIGITGWSAENYLELALNGPQRPDDFTQWSEDTIKWANDKNGSQDWWDPVKEIGYCLRFVSNAFMQKEITGESGYTDALNAARELYRFNQEQGGWHNAPRGAVIFFDGKGTNVYGHVGIYLGPEYKNGDYIINAYGKVQEITIEDAMAKGDVGKYIGWSYPLEIWRPTANPAAVDALSIGTQKGSQTSTQETGRQESSTVSPQPTNMPITLTLYVRDESASGPVIPGALVIGQDGSGNSFEQAADSNGYVTIIGDPGTWSFKASEEGYAINSWDQEITETCTKHAFLQKAESNSEAGLADDIDANIKALKDKDSSVRVKAAESLGKIADARAVDSLIETLNDENSDVRKQAAWALGEIDDPRAVDPLSYTSVKDADYYVREEAKSVLQKNTVGGNKVDSRSVNPIIGALKDENQDVRIRAAEALGQIKKATAVDSLIEALNDENSDVRKQAAWALGEIDDPRAVDPLSYTSVKDADYYVREEAKSVLLKNTVGGNKIDSRSVNPIIGALKDKNQDVRIRAAEALGQIKNATAVDSLIETLNDENSDVRKQTAWALGEIDDPRAVDPLSYTSVKDADYYVREEAKSVLQKNTVGGNKVDSRSVNPIIGALKDENQDVRIRAAEALGQIKKATAVDSLIEALNDENSDVRKQAAWALGEIDDPRVVDSLSYTSVKDADYYVREEAKEALKKLGSQG